MNDDRRNEQEAASSSPRPAARASSPPSEVEESERVARGQGGDVSNLSSSVKHQGAEGGSGKDKGGEDENGIASNAAAEPDLDVKPAAEPLVTSKKSSGHSKELQQAEKVVGFFDDLLSYALQLETEAADIQVDFLTTIIESTAIPEHRMYDCRHRDSGWVKQPRESWYLGFQLEPIEGRGVQDDGTIVPFVHALPILVDEKLRQWPPKPTRPLYFFQTVREGDHVAEFSEIVKRIGPHPQIAPHVADSYFRFFQNEEYDTHPWHNHAHEFREIAAYLDRRYAKICAFLSDWILWPGKKDTACLKIRNPYHALHDQFIELFSKEPDLLSNKFRRLEMLNDFAQEEYKKRRAAAIKAIDKWTDALDEAASRVRDMVRPMQGTYYSKAWAVEIAMRFSNPIERGAAIREMIANKRIPATSTRLLQDLASKKKRGAFFIDDEWKPAGGNQRKGCLVLALVPVQMMYVEKGVKEPHITTALYMPPKAICVEDYFGREIDTRLYFSPRQFASTSSKFEATFEDIKRYVIQQTKRNGKLSYSGDPEKRGRFSCKTKGCKFHLVVKYDYGNGFYVHLYDDSKSRVVGNIRHNH